MVKAGGYRFPAFTDFISMFQKKNHVLKYIFLLLIKICLRKMVIQVRHFPKTVPKRAEKAVKGYSLRQSLQCMTSPKNTPPLPPFPPFFQQVSKNAVFFCPTMNQNSHRNSTTRHDRYFNITDAVSATKVIVNNDDIIPVTHRNRSLNPKITQMATLKHVFF
jgi:hypothetical protein